MEQMKETLRAEPINRYQKILIADDNEINRELLRELLRDEYDIEEAADGNEAYAILQKKYREISVILLDLVMPNCDGFAFMTKVKDDPVLRNIPIVVLTGSYDKKEEAPCLSLGAVDFLTKPFNPIIIKARLHNIIRMKTMFATLTDIEFDELTGLYTKQAFYHHAKMLLESNPDIAYDVVISDIENFRMINEIYGMQKSNELIKSFADYSRTHCRNGICGRYSGDQIISIYPTLSEEEMSVLQMKFLEYQPHAPIPNVVLKYGIYQNVDRTLSILEMGERAYFALRAVAHNHARIVGIYDGPLSRHRLKMQMYETRFQNALQNHEFVLWYQPKYDVSTKTVVGAEALVRWNSPDGIIPPGEFLEIFEASGLVGQLDEYVFTNVCQYLKKRKEAGAVSIPISVNLSRASLYRKDIVQRYQKIVNDNGLDPKDVPIEITEGTAVASQNIKTVADAFCDAGFCLHMDDFGSGQSSLNGLNVLCFDVVKLDKSLIDHIGDKNGQLILKYTMGLAKELGLRLVAEGVENQTQFDFLKENGCDVIQGYYFSKPLPRENFEQILSNI